MTVSKISQILRNVWRHTDGEIVPMNEYDSPQPLIHLEAGDLIPDPVPEKPLHERFLAELDARRRTLHNSEALLVATINDKHRDLASTRMAIKSIEAAMVSLRADPITPVQIEKTEPANLLARKVAAPNN